MKKLFILTILIASLVLTGCSQQVVKEIPDEVDNNQSADSEQIENDIDDAGVTTASGNDKIKVFNIEDDQVIVSPLTITGQGVAFENNLRVELRNSDHVALVKEFTTIKSGEVSEMGDYSITLNFQFNNTKEGYIAVYEQSAEDGSELNLVEIPVKFGVEEKE